MRSLAVVATLALLFPLAQAAPPSSLKFARVQHDAQLISCAKPDYPKFSQRAEETGSTTLRYAVSAAGTVIDPKVVRSSGFRDLDRAAIAVLGTCHFRPATIDGKPVQAFMLAQYDWDLEP
ncbi:MAG: energy transducer TonB [Pseudomonadota bacterium]